MMRMRNEIPAFARMTKGCEDDNFSLVIPAQAGISNDAHEERDPRIREDDKRVRG